MIKENFLALKHSLKALLNLKVQFLLSFENKYCGLGAFLPQKSEKYW